MQSFFLRILKNNLFKKRSSMKKHIMCMALALSTIVALSNAAPQKNKHIVQEHIADLENKLKTDAPYAIERKRLVGYLRGYFNNRIHNDNKKLKKLDNPKTKALADSITASFEEILKTAGNHKQAAANYAQRATGIIGLNVRHRTGGKTKPGASIHPTAAEPVSKKFGNIVQDIGTMLGDSQKESVAKPTRRAGGVAAAGAAGMAGSPELKKRKPRTRKPVDPKKKQQKMERKKKRAAAVKKTGPKKPRTKPMSEKKKAKKAAAARRAAAAKRA